MSSPFARFVASALFGGLVISGCGGGDDPAGSPKDSSVTPDAGVAIDTAGGDTAPPLDVGPIDAGDAAIGIDSAPTGSTTPGWYLTGWNHLLSPTDITLVGWIYKGNGLEDYNEGKGDKNHYTVSTGRKDANGKMVASGSSVTTWTDPPSFVGPGQAVSIEIDRETTSSWGIVPMSTTIDAPEINPGAATSSAIYFATTDGTNYVENYRGVFGSLGGMPVDSKLYTKRSIIVNLGNTYGYRYNYEWRQ